MIQVGNTRCLLNLMAMPFDECVFAEISQNSVKFSVGVIYIKRKANKLMFVKKLVQFLDERKSVNRPFFAQ